jgi:hypothetical protein
MSRCTVNNLAVGGLMHVYGLNPETTAELLLKKLNFSGLLLNISGSVILSNISLTRFAPYTAMFVYDVSNNGNGKRILA